MSLSFQDKIEGKSLDANDFVVIDSQGTRHTQKVRLGQAHTIVKGAGHYIQDDAAEELAAIVIQFMQSNPT